MKKLFAIALIIFVLLPATTFAAIGTCTVVEDKIVVEGGVVGEGKHSKKVFTLSCTGGTGAEAGTVSNVTLPANVVRGWYLYSAETNPGAGVPPTDLYDVVINDPDGVDLAGGLLMNRSTANTELVNLGTGAYGYPLVSGALTIVHTNQVVISATWTLIITLVSE
jgi:hypothetical protein